MAFGAGAFALTVCVAYVVLRLLALGGEDAGAVRLHIPFYWRTALSLLHGMVAGVAAGLFVRDADAALGRIPMLVAVVVPGCALLAVVFP